jgi:RHS repeat-associated protein
LADLSATEPDASGAFKHRSPFAGVSSRGAPPIDFFAHYTPGQGLGPHGMGWRDKLSIHRTRRVGQIQYNDDDELISPWGLLRQGEEGDWYPEGLQPAVRCRRQGDSWMAIRPDGTRLWFEQRFQTERGTYAWYVTRALTLEGTRAVLTYDEQIEGDGFVLAEVRYGPQSHPDASRIRFLYEALDGGASGADLYVSRASGRAWTLRQRVRAIVAEVRDRHGDYQERWRYDLTYEEAAAGPAFYLTRIGRTFASGRQDPPITYRYDLALGGDDFAAVEGLDELFDRYGTFVFAADEVVLADLDQDGQVEAETRDLTLLRLEEDRWTATPLPSLSATDVTSAALLSPVCRNLTGVPGLDFVRHFARLLPQQDQPQVVAVVSNGRWYSDIVACSRQGEELALTTVEGIWELGGLTKLADLNGDQLTDLVSFEGGIIRILENTSDATGLSFREHLIWDYYPYDEPLEAWIRDINGDGVTDLFARVPSYYGDETEFFVWYGLGGLRFEAEGDHLPLFDNGRELTASRGHSYGLFDGNGDGVMDVIELDTEMARLYLNHGSSFHYQPLPGIAAATADWRAPEVAVPVLANLRGTGEVELTFSSSQGLRAIPLTRPSMGLLIGVDDGQGTALAFRYGRGPAMSGLRGRPRVLVAIEAVQAGRSPLLDNLDYRSPVLHGPSQSLRGFRQVLRQRFIGDGGHWSPFSTVSSLYDHDDWVASVLRQESSRDEASGLERFTSTSWEAADFNGVPLRRRTAKEQGYRLGELTATWHRQFEEYDGLCPRVTRDVVEGQSLRHTKNKADPAGLADALHCLTSHELLQTDDDTPAKVLLHLKAEHNDLGQLTKLLSLGDGTTTPQWERQRVGYDEHHRLSWVEVPGTGRHHFEYDDWTNQLQATVAPDGVGTEVSEFAALTDQILSWSEDRGGEPYQQWFGYDGWERTDKRWSSWGFTGDDEPLEQWSYTFATATSPAVIESLRRVAPASIRRGAQLFDGSGNASGQLLRRAEGWYAAELAATHPGLVTRHRGVGLLDWDSSRPLSFDNLLADSRQLATARYDALEGTRYESEAITTDAARVREFVYRLHDGLVIRETHENGVLVARQGRDAQGRLRWHEDAIGSLTSYQHDAMGRLVGIVFPEQSQPGHSRQFDSHGRVQLVSRDEVGWIRSHYDDLTGLLHQKDYFDVDDQWVRSSSQRYDPLGRLERLVHVAPGRLPVVYQYSYAGAKGTAAEAGQLGRLQRVEGPDFSRDMVYHPDGSLAHVSWHLADRWVVKEWYDYASPDHLQQRRRTVEDVETAEVLEDTTWENRYGSWGQLDSMVLNGEPLFYLTYDEFGDLDEVVLRDGSTFTMERDDLTRRTMGQVYQTSAGLWSAHDWDYDDRGLVTWERFVTADEEIERDYTHDVRGFLESTRSIPADMGTERYEYNAQGLLVLIEDALGQRELPGDRQAVWQLAGGTYEYDRSARAILAGDRSITYGAHGDVAEVHRPGESWSFTYDEAGKRLVRWRDGLPVAAFVNNLYLDGEGLMEPVRVAGQLVAVLDGGHLQQVAVDQRGTLFASDEEVDLAASYGGRKTYPDRLTRFLGYGARQYEPALGTIRMDLRDYDGTLGQFPRPDPHLLEDLDQCGASPVECTLFGFAVNDPINFTDPSGLGFFDFAKSKRFDEIMAGKGLTRTAGHPAHVNPDKFCQGVADSTRGAVPLAKAAATIGAAGVAAPVEAGVALVNSARALYAAGSAAHGLASRALLEGSFRLYLAGGSAGSYALTQSARLGTMAQRMGRMALDVNIQLQLRAGDFMRYTGGLGNGLGRAVGVGGGAARVASFGAGVFVGYQTEVGEALPLTVPPGLGMASELGAAFDTGMDVGTLLGQADQRFMESWNELMKAWGGGS